MPPVLRTESVMVLRLARMGLNLCQDMASVETEPIEALRKYRNGMRLWWDAVPPPTLQVRVRKVMLTIYRKERKGDKLAAIGYEPSMIPIGLGHFIREGDNG